MIVWREYKNQILLISANGVSYLGDLFFTFALNWWIISTTGDTKLLGILSSIIIIPMLILNIFGGSIVDSVNRKKLMIISDLISGVTMMILSLICINEVSISAIIVADIIISSSFAIFSISNRSIVSDVIKNEDISIFNTWFSSVENIVRVIAPILSGMMIGRIPISIIFLINGLTFIFSAFSESLISYKYKKKEFAVKVKNLELFKEGLTYIWKNRIVRNVIVLAACINFFIVGYNLYVPLYCNVILKSSNAYSGALTAQAVGGICILFTSKLFPKIMNEKNFLNGWIFTLLGLSILLIQFKSIVSLYISSFLYGHFLGQFNIMFFSFIQKNVDYKLLGRVFSVIFTVSSILMPFGNLVFGYLGLSIIDNAFFIIGISIIILTAIIKIVTREKINI